MIGKKQPLTQVELERIIRPVSGLSEAEQRVRRAHPGCVVEAWPTTGLPGFDVIAWQSEADAIADLEELTFPDACPRAVAQYRIPKAPETWQGSVR